MWLLGNIGRHCYLAASSVIGVCIYCFCLARANTHVFNTNVCISRLVGNIGCNVGCNIICLSVQFLQVQSQSIYNQF